ncbi:MAG: prolyl oligopeptidase family serine peptidase, partial [Myxococcota bacterium]
MAWGETMRQRQRAGWSNLQQVGLRVVGLWCVVVWAVIGLASPSVSMAWPRDVKAITHQGQRAMVYLPPKVHPDKPVPLLVGLHSWSTDYRQGRGVELARWCIEHGWAFIHPNFQGGNRHPNATGSPRAIADVIDAVDYIKTQTHVDEDRIYAMGWSGGGMMGLLLAAHHP